MAASEGVAVPADDQRDRQELELRNTTVTRTRIGMTSDIRSTTPRRATRATGDRGYISTETIRTTTSSTTVCRTAAPIPCRLPVRTRTVTRFRAPGSQSSRRRGPREVSVSQRLSSPHGRKACGDLVCPHASSQRPRLTASPRIPSRHTHCSRLRRRSPTTPRGGTAWQRNGRPETTGRTADRACAASGPGGHPGLALGLAAPCCGARNASTHRAVATPTQRLLLFAFPDRRARARAQAHEQPARRGDAGELVRSRERAAERAQRQKPRSPRSST